MPEVEQHLAGPSSPATTGWSERLVTILLVGGLFVLAGAFWAMNGVAVFAELVAGVWALCF